MPKGNIVAANELLLLMLTGYDFATCLVRFRSPGVRTVNYVWSFFILVHVLPVAVGVSYVGNWIKCEFQAFRLCYLQIDHEIWQNTFKHVYCANVITTTEVA